MQVPTTERHWAKYDLLCKLWGVEITGERLFGKTRAMMREYLRVDPYLNMISLRSWDSLAAHLPGRKHTLNVDAEDDGIVRGCSLAEAVCTMKHAARVWSGAEPVFVGYDDPSLKGEYPRRPEWG